jgi:transposase-like protein
MLALALVMEGQNRTEAACAAGMDRQTLRDWVHLYNAQLPQSALGSRTPMQTMKDRHKSHPHIFVKSPRNHTGCGT